MCACSRERRRAAARVGKRGCILEAAAPNRAVNIHPAGGQEKICKPLNFFFISFCEFLSAEAIFFNRWREAFMAHSYQRTEGSKEDSEAGKQDADIWPDSTSHPTPNISGPLLNQEAYSCSVHDGKEMC